jgi:hypothetical protein
MSEQCNTCGSFDDIQKCSFCPTMICLNCKMNHEPMCEVLQKAKQRGEGPTIANVPVPEHRAGHQLVEAGPADRPTLIRIPSATPIEPTADAPTQDEIPVYDGLTGETTERGAKSGTDPKAQQDLEDNK